MNNAILIIGAIPNPKDLKTYGGTTVLLDNFIRFCQKKEYKIKHINTYKYRYTICNLLYVIVAFLFQFLFVKYIMFNVSKNGAFKLFYYLSPLAFSCRKKVIFRKFGGNFKKELEECSFTKQQRMINRLLRTSLILVETKSLCKYLTDILGNTVEVGWFPNCREYVDIEKTKHAYKKRFVFISHVKESKGVDLILEVSNKLPFDYHIDIYGSIQEDKYTSNYFNSYRAEYKGALSSNQVLPILSQYDVLLLPTYWKGEGYPGIIIEALSLGIPAIATNWAGIPEIIENNKNGILIPVRDLIALEKAILSIDRDFYNQLSNKARRTFFENYESDIVNNRIYKQIVSL